MTKFLFAALLLASPAFAGENTCTPGHGVNCVDLCKMDPGNRLNNTDESETKISEVSQGTCKTFDGPDRVTGQLVITTYRLRGYNICNERYYESTIQRSGCRIRN